MDVEVSNLYAICSVRVTMTNMPCEGAGNIVPDSEEYGLPRQIDQISTQRSPSNQGKMPNNSL